MIGLSLGLGLSSTGGGSGVDAIAAELATLQGLVSGANKCAIFLPIGYSKLYAENTPITEVTTGSGNAVGYVEDLSGHANHLVYETNTAYRPTSQAGGLRFDGVNDYLKFAFRGGAASNSISLLRAFTTSDVKFVDISSNTTTTYFAIFDNSSSSTTLNNVTPTTIHIDGTAYVGGTNTRTQTANAVATGTPHKVENRAVTNVAALSALAFGLSKSTAGVEAAMDMHCFIVLDNIALGANTAAALASAQTLIDLVNASV